MEGMETFSAWCAAGAGRWCHQETGAGRDTRASPADWDRWHRWYRWSDVQPGSMLLLQAVPAIKKDWSQQVGILGPIHPAMLATLGCRGLVGAALAGPVPKRVDAMASAAPEMGTYQDK